MTDLSAVFAASHNLPTVSGVVQELILSFADATIDSGKITEQLKRDQTLTARVLRLANTPMYGGSRRISSISDAVLMLGFDALRTLVLSCGLTSAVKTPKGFDIKAFWGQSFKVAAVSAWLARTCRQNADIAFTVGLMHNLGDVLLFIVYPEKASAILQQVQTGRNRVDVENSLLGFSYAEVGAELARRWNFPEDMVRAIADQEQPLAAHPVSPQALLIYLAKILVQAMNAQVPAERLGEILPHAVLDALRINLDIVITRYSELSEAGSEVASLVLS